MKERFDDLRNRALRVLRESGVLDETANRMVEELVVMHAELEVQEEELRESQLRANELANHYRELFHDTPLAIVLVDRDLSLLQANSAAVRLLDLPTTAKPFHFDQFVASENLDAWYRLVGDPKAGGDTVDPMKDGQADGPGETILTLRALGGRRVYCRAARSSRANGTTLVVLEDVTETREAQDRHRALQERYFRVLEDSRDAVLIIDAHTWLIEEANRAAERLLNVSTGELIGRPLSEFFLAELRPRTELALKQATREPHQDLLELALQDAHGRRVDVEVASGRHVEQGRTLSSLLMRDVSERTRLAREREEVARMAHEARQLEALGRLALGFAHDVNNLLTSILTASSHHEASSPDELASALEAVHGAALRGRELTDRLTAIHRRSPLRVTRFDFVALVRGVGAQLRGSWPAELEVEVVGHGEPWHLVGDEAAWRLALLNLADNAREAMPGAGRLVFDWSTLPGGERRLRVSDDGEGMPPGVLARAFEPFFTTRPPNQGVGLGLSHARAVAEAHDATLVMESKVGVGTTLEFRFPAERSAAAETPQPPRPAHTPDPRGGARPRLRGRLLLVDDEPEVLRMTARLLRRGGLEVVEASSALLALEIMGREANFDVVVSDISMPGMDGEALAAVLAARHPQLPVILVSGAATDDQFLRLRAIGVKALIAKPFTLAELLESLTPYLRGAETG